MFKIIEGEEYLAEIDGIFTEEECKLLINRANEEGWHQPGTGGSYMRSIIVDRKLANTLYLQLKDNIPETYDGFKLLYINDHFRFSRYKKGGLFPVHKDGTNYDSGRVEEYDGYCTESIFTLNIFLNDNFEGGETDFFKHKKKHKKNIKYDSENKLKLRYSVKPKTGRGALFYSKQYHRGNTVNTPYKYLIRTDVMGLRI